MRPLTTGEISAIIEPMLNDIAHRMPEGGQVVLILTLPNGDGSGSHLVEVASTLSEANKRDVLRYVLESEGDSRGQYAPEESPIVLVGADGTPKVSH